MKKGTIVQTEFHNVQYKIKGLCVVKTTKFEKKNGTTAKTMKKESGFNVNVIIGRKTSSSAAIPARDLIGLKIIKP